MKNKLFVEKIFDEYFKDDTSFVDEKGIFGFINSTTYKSSEVRKIFHQAIKIGIDIGLRESSSEGNEKRVYYNTKDVKELEFLNKFYSLCDEYKMGLRYCPSEGLCVIKINF